LHEFDRPGATNCDSGGVGTRQSTPVLFLPGDTFATRGPDPVLQQIESFTTHRLSQRLL